MGESGAFETPEEESMPREWYQRLYLVLFVLFASIYLLIPTFFWHPKGAGLTQGVPGETPVSTPMTQMAPTALSTSGGSNDLALGTTPEPTTTEPMATGSAGAATVANSDMP